MLLSVLINEILFSRVELVRLQMTVSESAQFKVKEKVAKAFLHIEGGLRGALFIVQKSMLPTERWRVRGCTGPAIDVEQKASTSLRLTAYFLRDPNQNELCARDYVAPWTSVLLGLVFD